MNANFPQIFKYESFSVNTLENFLNGKKCRLYKMYKLLEGTIIEIP